MNKIDLSKTHRQSMTVETAKAMGIALGCWCIDDYMQRDPSYLQDVMHRRNGKTMGVDCVGVEESDVWTAFWKESYIWTPIVANETVVQFDGNQEFVNPMMDTMHHWMYEAANAYLAKKIKELQFKKAYGGS